MEFKAPSQDVTVEKVLQFVLFQYANPYLVIGTCLEPWQYRASAKKGHIFIEWFFCCFGLNISSHRYRYWLKYTLGQITLALHQLQQLTARWPLIVNYRDIIEVYNNRSYIFEKHLVTGREKITWDTKSGRRFFDRGTKERLFSE